jgi:hypothetical protein
LVKRQPTARVPLEQHQEPTAVVACGAEFHATVALAGKRVSEEAGSLALQQGRQAQSASSSELGRWYMASMARCAKESMIASGSVAARICCKRARVRCEHASISNKPIYYVGLAKVARCCI